MSRIPHSFANSSVSTSATNDAKLHYPIYSEAQRRWIYGHEQILTLDCPDNAAPAVFHKLPLGKYKDVVSLWILLGLADVAHTATKPRCNDEQEFVVCKAEDFERILAYQQHCVALQQQLADAERSIDKLQTTLQAIKDVHAAYNNC